MNVIADYRKKSSRIAAVLTAGLVLSISANSQAKHAEATFEPYTLTTYDQQPHPAELGHLWVPENRRTKSDRLIQLAFVRLKSSSATPAAPIVFLAGGPGVPGIGMARVPVYVELFEKLRPVADVILLDQRGSGMSSPNLNDCPINDVFPADAFANRQNLVRALTDAAGACSSYWRSKGVDLTGYNTEESADDIEDLRQALGATRISLIGHSYGTELGLAVIRRHGESVERAVLAGVEGPGDHATAPSVVDLQLKKIADLAAKDPNFGNGIPDLVSVFKHDAEQLDSHPLALAATREKTKTAVTLNVGGVALRFITERLLANGRNVAILPALLESVSAGDDSLFRQRVEALYNDFDSGISLMGMTMDCAAPTPPERRVQAEAEARTSLFGDVSRIDMQPALCQKAVGTFSLGSEYFEPLYSNVPVLFLSGTLDSNTPPMKAERIRWGFPHSTHIVIENGFHETLPAAAIQNLVADFFEGKDVAGRRVVFEPPRFLSLAEAKAAAASHR